MIRFVSFGSGSCGNCYFLSNGRDALFVDAGVGIRRLKRDAMAYGVKAGQAGSLLVTHDHADHIKAAGYLSDELDLRVYTTRRIHEGMLHNYHAMRKVKPERKVEIETGAPFQIGSFSVEAFPIPHDSAENVGYCIESEGAAFVIMTDVGAVTDAVKEYVRRANYLVIEANYDREMLEMGPYPAHLKRRIASGTGHLSNEQTAAVLAENFHEGLRRVWLCHLSEENNHPELARKTVEMKLREYGIVAGADFQLDVLKREVAVNYEF